LIATTRLESEGVRSEFGNIRAIDGLRGVAMLGALAAGALFGLYAVLAGSAPLLGEHAWLLFNLRLCQPDRQRRDSRAEPAVTSRARSDATS
jgi:hypothetical protein